MPHQTIPITQLITRPALRSLLAKAAQSITARYAQHRERRSHQEAFAQLHRFPDYLLKDIGVLRGDLPDKAPSLMDYNPHLIASGLARSLPVLPQNLSSR